MPGSYLPLAGGTMTGNIVINNNIELRWKDNGGVERTVLQLDSSNNLYLGKSGGGTVNIVSGTSYTTALSFDSSQAATFTGVLSLPDGSAGAPAISNTGDANTGMYWPGDHQVGFTVNNSRKFYIAETKAYFKIYLLVLKLMLVVLM